MLKYGQMKPFEGITKNVFVMGVASFLTDASTEIIYPLLPKFLTQVLRSGPWFVGLVEGVAESTASVFKLFSGWFSDRINRRKVLVISGYSLSSATRPFIAISTAGWHVLVARFIDRIGKGIRTSPRDALIADSAPKDKWGKAFGFHRGMDHLGAVVGSLMAFGLMSAFKGDYKAVFWVASIPAVLCVIVLSLFLSERRRKSESEVDPATITPIKFSLKPFEAKFKFYLLALLVFTLGNSSDAFLLLRADNFGVSAPLIWAVLHVVKSLSSTPGSAWSDKIGRKKVIALGWGIYALIYIGFALASRPIHIWLLFCAYGLYFGLTEGTEKAMVADLAPANLRGTAYGMYNLVIGLAALPASLIMGILLQTFGAHVAFSFGAGLALLAVVLLLRTGIGIRDSGFGNL